MDINFELYKIFYHAAKAGNFSEAGQKLFISQSAVSQAIRNLEEKTGSLLFYRKARAVQLTREGELLFKHVEQAYHFIKVAEEKLQEVRNLDTGEVRLGVADTICRHFMISTLEAFNSLYSGIRIQVVNRTSSQILQLLKNGTVDIGIVTLPVSDPGLMIESFQTVEDIFVACRKFSSLSGRSISLEELVQHPLLLLPANSSTRKNLGLFLQDRGLAVSSVIELESIELLVEFAKIGLGVAHVLKESAAGAIEKGELFEVIVEELLPPRQLGIVTIKDVPLSRAAAEFIRILKEKG
jgi:DNA-binding transcriptional LysR family regulator